MTTSLYLSKRWQQYSKAIALLLFVFSSIQMSAQFVNIPITGFNNDVVANGTGLTNTVSTGTIPDVTNPTIGIDGVGWTFIDATYKWYPSSTAPACFLPATGIVPSLLTSGLSYQLQNYTGFNALSIASNSFTGSVIPTTGSIALVTPNSYGQLKVLYETVQNTAGNTITATITFTDASTQVISGNTFVNWFTNTGTAFNNISRAQNAAPGVSNGCGTGPYLFEISLNINPANYSKQVQSVSFNFSSALGAAANTVNYLHVLALGGISPCALPIDQPTALNLSSPTGTTVAGTFTAASGSPSGYLTVIYPTGSIPTDPVSGTNYVAGNALGLGKVVSSSSATSFSASGLLPGVTYEVYVYSYNSGSCATVYNTSSPLTDIITTSGAGASLLISPFGDGGFETGTTLATNNWNVVNAATNAWTVGTLPTGFTNRSAYISNNGGAAWAYTNSSITASHIYKDITFPAGQSDISLSFNWKALGEASSWDAIIVYTCPTTITPITTSPTGTANTATWTGGSPTAIGAQLWNQGTNLQTFTACLPASFAGTTQRIVITWKNDGSGGVSPPAAIDNIALVASTPSAPSNQATGLTLTAVSTSQINGSFTAATSAPTGYIVVRYPTGVSPTAPATGTTYIAGNALGAGTVVSVGTALTFSNTGLFGGTTYDYYVYDYSNSACAGITYNTVAPLMGTASTNPCGSISSPITVGPTGTYPTLSGAGGAIAAVQTSGISAPTVIELQSTYTAAGESYPILLNYNACITPINTLTIRPEAATAAPLVISSASPTATIDMNGASNIIIDGRPGGVGTDKYLSIVNTSSTVLAAGNAILMRNDANSNTLTYLDLQAANLNPASNTGTVTTGAIPGVIAIHSTTGGITGNDNNTISFNDIHSVGTTGNLLNVGIYAYNATTVGSLTNNDNNTITNNNIYDCFNAATATAGINVLVGNNNYTITNNSYYKSPLTAYVYTTNAITHRGFWITPNASAVASSGFNISNNFIGGTAPQCGGAPFTTTTSLATVTNAFNGMDISVGTFSPSSVQNNVFTNFNVTSGNTAATAWVGINIAAGNVNIGTITGNLIGSTTLNGAIAYTASANTGGVIGIRTGGGTTINIANNIVSGIDLISSTSAVTPVFNGINSAGGTTVNITNNTIGSASLLNSINAVSASTGTGVQSIRGIIVNGGTTSTVTGNLIANMNSNTIATGTQANSLGGIYVTLTSTTVSNNIIRNLSSSTQTTNGGANAGLIGISITSTTAPAIISGNTIHSLINTNNTTVAGPVVAGLYYGGASGTANLIEKNNIHSLVLKSTAVSTAAAITGMDIAGGQVTIRNNMIRLGYDEAGNSIVTSCLVRGISKNANIANIYFNSVYVGGTGVLSTPVANTFAFQRTAAAITDDIRNNIFVNNRSNATTGSKHYQVSLSSIATLTMNYNDYFGNGTGAVFAANVGVDVPSYSAGWISGDNNSVVGDPQFINPIGDPSTGDLHIHPSNATVIEQNGVNIVSVTEDFDGQTRSSSTPDDIGADAGNFIGFFCSSGPASATASLTVPSAICGTGTKTIILTGFTPAPGYTYQWQESTTGLSGSFVNVTTGTGGTANTYTTATLISPMYYQCVISCTYGGSPLTSSSVLANVTAAPTLTVTPASGTTVCSGANVDLSASGALSYVWSCNPGLTGYPIVSLLSTRNNLPTVTARPTATLATGTTAPPATSATPTWIYTVVGTDANGCTSSTSLTLSVVTSATVPLELASSSSPTPLCAPGIPVTLNVSNAGIIGAGQWIYNWYDNAGTTLLQSTTTASNTDSYSPPTPTGNGNNYYLVKLSNTLCPSSYGAASPSYFVGYTALAVPTNANCGDNGTISIYPEGQTDFTTWYSNDFSTGLQGPSIDALYSNANITAGRCNITNQVNGVTGAFLVRNPGSINSNNLQVDFKMSTAPRGFAFNILGADGMAWSYGPDVTQGALTGGNAESGSGTGFKLAFDATDNAGGNNPPGAYLMYNCNIVPQGPNTPGVLAFRAGSFWQGLVNAPVSILISENGFVTVSVNNQVIFDHVPLPSAYLTSNKSNWIHSFTARTGGSNQLHAIDDLNIRYNSYEYSVSSTTGLDGGWSTDNIFTGLAAGTYPVWIRSLNDNNCFAFTGNVVVGTSPSPSSANTIPTANSSSVVCYASGTVLTTDIFVPGANFLWESAPALAGPWAPAAGVNNNSTYSTGPLLADTYFRLTFTCPSSSPVVATPLLVTVNAGTINSTNSPQQVNCTGDVATLTASPGPNSSCVWYTVASGGSPVFNGNTYTVVPASLPATYYVEPVTSLFSSHYDNGGLGSLSNVNGTTGSGVNITTRFTTTASIRIDSIFVNPSAAGTLTIALQNAGSATNIASFNFTVTAAMIGNFTKVPVNLIVPASGNYQLLSSGIACSYFSSYTGGYGTPNLSLGGVFTIVGGATSATGANSTSVYGTAFRFSITASCPAGSGVRTPVLVDLSPANIVSASSGTGSLCVGAIRLLEANSPTSYSSYSWTPITDLYFDAAATIPYSAGANTDSVYFKPTSAGAQTYVASTVGSGCTNTGSTSITVIPNPSIVANAAPAFACNGSNVQLNASISSINYSVASIPFLPEAVPATVSTIAGDEAVQTVNLGFNFGYFGNNYNNVIIHTNGYIQLGGSTPTCLSCFTPPAAANSATPNNWVGIWADMNVTAGQVTYGTTGAAPNRKFVVNYNAVNFFSATPSSTHQIILNENDNSIEIHLTSNTTTSTNQRAMGIENLNGTAAFFPAARNAGTWTGNNEAWKFTPITGSYTYDWSTNPTYLTSTTVANPIAQAMTVGQAYAVLVTDLSTGCSNTATVSVPVNDPSSSTTTATTPCGVAYLWNGNTYTTSGTYVVTTVNAAGCDSVQTLNLTEVGCNTSLTLNVFIQGYWNGVNGMVPVLANQFEPTTANACDSIDVLLKDAIAPYATIASTRAVLNQDGTCTAIFGGSYTASYYIALEHRSAICTWSAAPVSMAGSPNYNFTIANTQSYGPNMVEVAAGVWAMYSGDIVKDPTESIDLTDIAQVELDNGAFAFGYQVSDINGDGSVDLSDFPLVELNLNAFVFCNRP